MKKALGIVFALALFLLPIAWGAHAEDNISTDQTVATDSSAVQPSGPFSAFRNFILKNIIGGDTSQSDKVNADNAKNKLSELRDKFESFLKKLNNTF